MLASMRAEQSGQVWQQSEQARRQAEHTQQLMEVLQSSLGSLRAEAQDYTDRSCESVRVKGELEKDLQALRDEVRDIRSKAVWRQTDMAGCRWPDKECFGSTGSVASAPPGAMDGDWGLVGAACPWRAPGGPLAASQPLGNAGLLASSFPPSSLASPPGMARALSLSPPPLPPRSPFPCFKSRKPAEYDSKVAWESYAAQFDLLVAAQGWDQAEKAL
ncbi:hypothetical protein E2C01_102638 [Portunus trituberculatus]|uniref:Uncharacterized protein n=1 Tax=Portunus trituberculatus TaxID=210409 RepID=A0A5B7KHT7_PORTR|nr:hypothetical protein [Portunus trituberculatus]